MRETAITMNRRTCIRATSKAILRRVLFARRMTGTSDTSCSVFPGNCNRKQRVIAYERLRDPRERISASGVAFPQGDLRRADNRSQPRSVSYNSANRPLPPISAIRRSPLAIRYGVWLLGLLLCMMAPAFAAELEFVILIKNHQFIPAQLVIPVGEKVTIILDNQDNTPEEFESYSLNREKHIPPNSRVTLYIGPLSAGRYVYQGEDREGGGAAALGVLEAR